VVNKVIQQVQKINIDGVLDASYITRYIDQNKTALFRRVGMTEKPDVAVGKMLEGRVAIVVDGSPMVLTVPYLYVEDLQSPGDYYEDHTMTSLNRLLRFVSVLASVLLPSLYVCLQMYNYQIIPLKFLITVLNATQAIPFSPLAEMILIIVIFDILREANLRMPSAVGISLSLVGAIVLGDAAVKAGLIGAPAVMIGALSGIGLFTMPDNTLILSLLRLVITFIAGVMGILGVILSMMVILFYLCSMQGYHTPFLVPFTPPMESDKQDAVMNKPLTSWTKRPKSIPNKNQTRRGK
jgi:spore germination protein KA